MADPAARLAAQRPAPGSRTVALGRAAAAAGLLLLVVTWCLSSLAQIRDSTGVDHTSAVWAGLAQYANDGVLYPALERDGYYGGTRYMPVPVLLHAAAARATGEYFVAAKLLACFYVLACVGLLLALARRLNAGMVLTALLLVCVLLTRPVWSTASAGNPDGLPLAFQLLALLCVLGGRDEAPSPLRLSAAAFLCSLAVFSKLSAVWAPAAIVLWLVRSHPRRALLFLGTCLIAGGILFGLTMLLSEGRFLSDALAISFARSARGPGAQVLPSLASALFAAANRVATLLAGSALSLIHI